MFRALLKKQLMEIRAMFFRDRKTGKTRSGAGFVGMCILYVFVFASVAFMFFGIGLALASVLVFSGYGWMYFCIMMLIGILFGTLGSVFNTYASLYQAKDNDFLFSLPVKPSVILASRLLGVYLMGMLYELLVMLPAYFAYTVMAGFSVATLFSTLCLIVMWGFPVLALTCLLGWVIALIASRLRNKSFITVIISLVFIALYYVFIFRMDGLFDSFAEVAVNFGDAIQGKAYVVYLMGRAFIGDLPGFALSAAFCALCLFLTHFILSRSYIRLATANRGEKKKAYVEKASKTVSPFRAFFRKELKRFTSSASYMLNCGLGIAISVIAAAAVIIKYEDASSAIGELYQTLPVMASMIPVLSIGVVGLLCSMNAITAPSVSLEGKSLWIPQSLPVDPKDVLRAKVALQLVVTVPAVVLLSVALSVVMRASVIEAVLMVLAEVLFAVLTALIGLIANLLKPNFTWTNESYPIKQSMSVMLALFGGWLIAVILTVPYIFLSIFVDPRIYMALEVAVLALASALLMRWVNGKGSEIFANLS